MLINTLKVIGYIFHCIIILVQGYQYDIFISAHNEIRNLVEENILKPLEQDCNPPYKICWHLRDFVAGVPIVEQICEAVTMESRKILFVFSDQFMDSIFCRIELDQAYHRLMTTQTRCLIPIALSEKSVPSKLKNTLTYLPVVLTNEHSFIRKLRELIGNIYSVLSGVVHVKIVLCA